MMKTAILILILATTIISCQSPEKKAQSAIKKYLERTLDDASSYEPVEFGSLDSAFAKKDSVSNPIFYGYTMIHSYRSKNIIGATTLKIEEFSITMDLKYASQEQRIK